MAIKEIRRLMRAERFEAALAKLEGYLKRHPECSEIWVLRGDLIQLLDRQDGPPLSEAAKSYEKALWINPNSLEALEGLAHYYDAVDLRPKRARRHAQV